jgi:hypothetical protein
MSNDGSLLPEFIAAAILAILAYALSFLFPAMNDNLRLAIAGVVAIVGWIAWRYVIGQRFKRFTHWLGRTWARLSNRTKAFVSTIKSFFRSTWGRRILVFWLLLLILEYVRSQLPLWPVTLLTFSLQLLLLLGLVFQISISRLGETHIKPYPQVFLSNPKCDKFRATASDSWKPAVVYAEPWRVTWRDQARDLIAVVQSGYGYGIRLPMMKPRMDAKYFTNETLKCMRSFPQSPHMPKLSSALTTKRSFQ